MEVCLTQLLTVFFSLMIGFKGLFLRREKVGMTRADREGSGVVDELC